MQIPSRNVPVWIAVLLGIAVIAIAVFYDANRPAPTPDQTPTAAPAPAPGPNAAGAEPGAPAEPTAGQPAEAAPDGDPAPEAAAPAPSNPEVDALVAQARALEHAGKRKQALELYEKALTVDPNAAVVLSKLAFGFLNRGKNEKAREYALRAVEQDPGSSEGWIVLGAARHALGDRKGARDAYKQCADQGTGDYVQECQRMVR